ncbi:hypothetical protein [Methanolobus vulcani]|nr:hypothetical protein [Methanolobus vulcani]
MLKWKTENKSIIGMQATILDSCSLLYPGYPDSYLKSVYSELSLQVIQE